MTIRYVGPGGNNGNSGLTWALRKLTLNGVEDTPVVAGDTVYAGPGVYREQLTVDVSGGAGNIITYIGDVSGEHTDGVGGIVRITGSDNDSTTARPNCIGASSKTYRTFRGFSFDLTSAPAVNVTGIITNWIFEDCCFHDIGQTCISLHDLAESAMSDVIIRRCLFINNGYNQVHIYFRSTNGVQDANSLVENCVFLGYNIAFGFDDVGGVAIKNCLFSGNVYGIRILDAPPIGYTAVTVNNCVLAGCFRALYALALGEIVEDYNTFWVNSTDRTNVAVGGNSETYPALLLPPILHAGAAQISGFKYPWWISELSEWSLVRAITGANEPTEDLHGIARPVTASKNSWGPTQFRDMERETGTVRTGSVSMAIRDAGRHQIWVPVTATSTTIQVYVYREANYAGLLPQMIIKQPGQADDITTDVGAAGGWNLLTTTLVPAALPPYVVVELVSRNTNGAADEVFFDDLDVS